MSGKSKKDLKVRERGRIIEGQFRDA